VYADKESNKHYLATLSLLRSEGMLEFNHKTEITMTHDYSQAEKFAVKMSRNLGDTHTKIMFSDG
jgi:hypothetical protein